MNNQRPRFEKKELALSSTPYVYLPVDIPVYTVEVSHREEIDGDLLQQALDSALRRMPYLTDTLEIDHGAVYYAKNPLPMKAAHASGPRPVGGAETNYHLLDLCWDGNKTWFSMFHGFCDGQGVNAFLESVLYHYYCLKDGVKYDTMGIRTEQTPMTEAETYEPCSKIYEVSPDFKMPERKQQVAPYHLPEIFPNPAGDVLEYGYRLPSEAFMRFVKENGTSPSVMIAMLVGEAVRRLHPDADAPIMANIPVSVRRMLGCEETFKNCSSRAILPVCGTPLDALPFAQRAAQLRGILKQQMNPDQFRSIYNMIGAVYGKRMAEATDYREEISKPAGFSTVTHDTFYVDYIGSMHKTAYADRLTDVRFLCKPAAGNTLHLNIIEHNGEFRITCLACSEIAPLADALEQVIKGHGLPMQRMPVQRFGLPMTSWREGIYKRIAFENEEETNMKITKSLNGTALNVTLEGRLDTTTAPELEKELNASLDAANTLTLDFAKLDYISSAGLRVLLSAHKAMAKKGGMKVVHVNEIVGEVFDVTGFGDILTIE